MNEQPSAQREDESPGSPKRKKVRAKYASRACVSCRRSKLKCSGENPCQRCLDNGRRCFYSEDQTAAEALQNLSRPTPVQPLLNANGNGALRRSILPRHDGTLIERRASDASVLGISMEARMSRIEGMMEALIQDRGVGMTPQGSIERDDTASEGFQADPAFDTRLETFGASSVASGQQYAFQHDSPDTRTQHSIAGASPPTRTETSSIRFGSRDLAFPNGPDYQKYVDYYFVHVNPYLPCVNETDFRMQSEQMLGSLDAQANHLGLLALNYSMFACVDILAETNISGTSARPAGSQWFQTSDELVGNRKFSGRGDLSLVQVLVLQSSYLTYADRPNAAYNMIGLACRLCFQFELHRQRSWGDCNPFETHMRQRIFWSLYFTDRRIALSCGRPYGIRDAELDVDQPQYFYDRALHPEQPLPEPDLSRSANMYLRCMIAWAKLAGDVWSQIFAISMPDRASEDELTAILDARIKYTVDMQLPTIPVLPPNNNPEARHLRQYALVQTRFNHLRLLLRRPVLLSLKYDSAVGRDCGDLAVATIQHLKSHAHEARESSSFRFHMAISLGTSLLTLSALLVRDLATLNMQDRASAWADAFQEATTLLDELSSHVQIARRILDDFQNLIRTVTTMLNNQDVGMSGWLEERFSPEDFPVRLQISNLREYSASADSWDAEFQQPNARGFGVSWI